MPTTARKTTWYSTGGPWGTGLLLFGVGSIMQGLGYLTRATARLPEGLAAFGDTVTIKAWAILWIAAGLWAAFKALRPPQKHSDVWPLVGITVLWSCAYAGHWAFGVIDHGDWANPAWSSAIAWGSIAAVLVCWGRCVNPPRHDP